MILPDCCLCCCFKKTRRDRTFIKGFQNLEKEIRIDNVLMQLRVLTGLVKDLIPAAEWELGFSKYSLRNYNHS